MKRSGSESQCEWTSEEIAERLGSSTLVFERTTSIGAREIATIRQAGITRVEICGCLSRLHFDYRNRVQVSEITAECRKQGVTVVSVHGPDLPYDSEYEEVRKGAVNEALAAVKVAEEMGASVFVDHFGTDGHAEKTVSEILRDLDGSQVKLAIENGTDLREFMMFVDRIGSDRLGMCVDLGHTRDPDGVNPFIKKNSARMTMAQCGTRLFHVHLQDVLDRDHLPPFDGNVPWQDIFAAFRDIDYKGEFVFEVHSGAPGDELQKTAAFPRAFVRRYASSQELS